MLKEELLQDLEDNGFEIYTIEDEREFETDLEIVEEMENLDCTILLYNAMMARYWFFTNINAMANYFNNDNKVSYETACQKLA